MSIPLSLYIHIPWCVRKCPYCDFNSHALREELPERDYIARLLWDLQNHKKDGGQRPIHSIFIGGGTPSLFSAYGYQQLFDALRNELDIPRDIEITLEANPGASEQQRFYGFREAGINRLSLGVQSWHPQKLQALGRIHDEKQAVQAVAMAKAAGFTNFNIDIMYGLPQQSVAEALADLQNTLLCEPTHISWYQLTLEPHTYFHRFPPPLPDDEMQWQMQEQGRQILQDAGFIQYEVSAYCRDRHYSRHNLNYWQFGDYIGIGAGAHSKITHADGTVKRYWKIKNPRDYLCKNDLLDGHAQITREELLFEFLMNALRLYQPVSLLLASERTGLALEYIQTILQQKLDKNLVNLTGQQLTLTTLGRRFLNQALLCLLT